MKRLLLFAVITAIFISCKQDVYYTISSIASPSGSGVIVVSPSSGQVLDGTSVTLFASPNGDYVFTGWGGSISGTENPKTVTVASDINVVANFTLKSYPLTLSVEGDGVISEREISTKTDYGSGTVVELTAKPAEHWLFDHWEGDLNGNMNPVQIAVTSPKTAKAIFVKKMYDLTVSVEGEGAVSETVIETKSGTYQEGTVVELTATPSMGWTFSHWEGDISGIDNPVQVTISSPQLLKAVFIPQMYDLTVNIQGKGVVNEKIIETKTGSYQDGSVVELTAIPDEFWAFDHWEGDLSSNENPTAITVNTAKQIKAVFVENDPGIANTETDYISPEAVFKWLGMGWNIGGNIDGVWQGVSGETFNGNLPATQDLFNKVKSAGFKSVRVPVCWIGQFDSSNGYQINKEWLDRVGDYVHYCKNAGLNAIIDFHYDGWRNSDGYMNWEGVQENMFWLDLGRACLDTEFNNTMKEAIHSLWTHIARYFRDEGDYLIFQPFNELSASPTVFGPNPSDERACQVLAEWTQVFVDAVRATGGNNASRWLLIQGIGAHEILPTVKDLKLPTDYCSNNRLIVSVHCYEPYLFSHGFVDEWGHTAQISEQSIWDKDEEYLSEIFALANETFIKRGIPVCLDEMGCRNRNTDRGSQFQLYYLEYMAKVAHDNVISPFLWDFSRPSDGFSYINHNNGEYSFNGERIIARMREAVYNDDPSYTLLSVYDSAPFSYESTEVSIPDPIFSEFLLLHFDRNKDGILSSTEANTIAYLVVPSMGISSLEGIEYMTHLKYLDCGYNNLSALIVDNNTELETINCENNAFLSSLDVTMLPSLKYLNAQDCIISELDVSKNPLLIQYQVNSNPLKSVPDLTNNPYLEQIHINKESGAYYIPSDYFTAFPMLKGASFGGYDKMSIDLSKNGLLESIWAHDMPEMEVLDLRNCPRLNYLFVPNCPKLKTVIVHPNVSINSLEAIKDTQVTIVHP